MDALEALLNLLLYWRVLVCLAATTLIALALNLALPWFSDPQTLVFAVAGLAPGLLWHAQYEAGTEPYTGPYLSRPAAALTACLAGMLWGAASGTSLAAALTGGLLLALVLLLWYLRQALLVHGVTPRSVIACGSIALATYLITSYLSHAVFKAYLA
ncbi:MULTISPECIES: hypothetical protein [Pseudomonadaceae]|uniref:hypothetical protein n=1 Tax=Pseudomonadaceae TaxID=135621 RepID=UPI0030039CC8